MHFPEKKIIMFFIEIFLGIQEIIRIKGNGLTSTGRQAITWTNDDRVHWRV